MYRIDETQKRTDGVVNVLETVTRSTITGGLSYLHERVSKMVANEQFESVGILLCDENGRPVRPNGYAFIHDGIVDWE